MGTEAIWVPLAAAALSGGASYVNSRNVAKKQDNTLAAGIRAQAGRQKEVNAKTGDLISQLGASNPEGDKASALSQYLAQLGQNKGTAHGSLGQVAGASDTYASDAQDAAMGIDKYGSDVAGLMSRIDAPQTQRRREGVAVGDYGAATDTIKRNAEGDAFLNNMQMQGIRRNPLLDAFAAAASAYGGSKAGGAGALGGGSQGITSMGLPFKLGLGGTYGTGRGLAAAGFAPALGNIFSH